VKWIPESTRAEVSGIPEFGSRFSSFVKDHLRNNTNLITPLRDVSGNFPLVMRQIAESPIDTVDDESQIEALAQGTEVHSAGHDRSLPTLSRCVSVARHGARGDDNDRD
jgi:hypothetical protein